jgi:hypothetical protein
MTKEKVIKERRAGLKSFDVVVGMVGLEKIVQTAIEYYKESNGQVWDFGWNTFDWALGNAFRDLKTGPIKGFNGQSGFNADEALSPEILERVRLELNLGPYIPTWERD